MNKADNYMYKNIKNILQNGYIDENPRPKYADGTPAHTLSVNHVMRKYDLSKGEFPICSLRPQAWKTSIKEIFTIYQKQTNVISEMEELGVNWWNPWDIGDGTIGQRYGATVKRYNLIDNLIKDIQSDPYGRRKVMSLWQEKDLNETVGLAPCAFLTIWNVRGKYLDMCLIQRSGDMLTASGGGAANEIQYASLLMMIARHCGYEAGVFTHFVANEQIYSKHIWQANEMLNRYNLMCNKYNGMSKEEIENDIRNNSPNLILNPEKTNFYDFTIEDFTMVNYNPTKPQLTLELGI